MIRKALLVAAVGLTIGAPVASADVAVAADKPAAAREVAINTGSAGADAAINGIIAAIFGPPDPSRCKFPYCF
ncbi:hypothetical protein [Nocardia mexicana]|uniref:Uncharacterized protein n=1 Tax=Nocardia mexicana TaxID=279262 RepID=A0A370H5A4_9NOCA|nr:hypothetical protein [Nocardia mexicana]RDI51587.1 hypothetical protein DFR68_10470 [Nocardia mexicana]